MFGWYHRLVGPGSAIILAFLLFLQVCCLSLDASCSGMRSHEGCDLIEVAQHL
jgi:hypothetical protein